MKKIEKEAIFDWRKLMPQKRKTLKMTFSEPRFSTTSSLKCTVEKNGSRLWITDAQTVEKKYTLEKKCTLEKNGSLWIKDAQWRKSAKWRKMAGSG